MNYFFFLLLSFIAISFGQQTCEFRNNYGFFDGAYYLCSNKTPEVGYYFDTSLFQCLVSACPSGHYCPGDGFKYTCDRDSLNCCCSSTQLTCAGTSSNENLVPPDTISNATDPVNPVDPVAPVDPEPIPGPPIAPVVPTNSTNSTNSTIE